MAAEDAQSKYFCQIAPRYLLLKLMLKGKILK